MNWFRYWRFWRVEALLAAVDQSHVTFKVQFNLKETCGVARFMSHIFRNLGDLDTLANAFNCLLLTTPSYHVRLYSASGHPTFVFLGRPQERYSLPPQAELCIFHTDT